MNKVQIIIQARMTSTRLPGKVMLPLCESTVLQVMLERLAPWHENIIVATTDDGTEQPIVSLCESLNVDYFKGSTNDVLSRYYQAASQFGATDDTAIVRLTSDCPLIDNALTTQAINTFLHHDYDMVSLGPHSGFPRGLDCCVFPYSLLALTHQNATSPPDREHVTLGMAKFKSLKTYVISALEDHSHFRLTLDEPDDYIAIQAIYQALNHRTDFSYQQLTALLLSNPHLHQLNSHVEQKTV
ncbi:glycosyltransferase family protein [Pseudoalteromonas sp. OOF1S-7]|uniref:glycosyltransferase family protein n=1 Tax=Pseudoalteromonas sp. OOF1S-7 TaxID=2917757 RepID=UPI001EF41E48|nr:glycosyltransferase family protein [Pseudoalteromonas sp. OOF1S-7]MCG7537138.1 glycosyltransferase family protein [Pseudoalteromonas sp. OOF1S-7]